MKIKSVKIKAFRLFADTSVSFTNVKCPDKAANFVAMYAPNGFGKTSLFDAIEFCMTKSIHRVRSNFKENFAMDQKQGLATFIHNKDLPETPIEITMSFDDREDVTRICEPKEECAMLRSENVENKFFRDAILSQDWLTEFISSRNSAERFRIFMENFDETRPLLDYYQSLTTASKQMAISIGKKEREFALLEKQIDRKINAGVINLINDAALKLRNNGVAIEKQVAPGISFLEMKMEAEAIAAGTLSEENTIKALVACFDNVYIGEEGLIKIESIDDWQNRLDETRVGIKGCTDVLDKIAHLNNLILSEEQHNATLTLKLSELNTYVFLLDNYERYCECCKQMLVVSNNRAKYFLERKEKEKNVADVKWQIQRISAEIEKNENQKDNLGKQLVKLHEIYKEYNTVLTKQKNIAEELQSICKYREEHKVRIQDLDSRYSKLLKTIVGLRNKQFVVFAGLFENEISELFKISERFSKANEELKAIELRIEEKSKLVNDIQKLLLSSQCIVSHLNGSKCPLCGFDYENHESLLKSVSQNMVLSSSIKEDSYLREKLMNEIDEIEKNYNRLIRTLIAKVEDDMSDTKMKISKEIENGERLRKKTELLQAENENNESLLKDKFSEYVGCVEEDKRHDIETLLRNVETVLNKHKEELTKNNKIVSYLTNLIVELTNKIAAEDKSMVELRTNDFYVQYISSAVVNNPSQENFVEWKRKKTEIQAAIAGLKQMIDNEKREILSLHKEGIDKTKLILLQQEHSSLKTKENELNGQLAKTFNYLKQECQIDDISSVEDKRMCEKFHKAYKIAKERHEAIKKQMFLVDEYIRTIDLGMKYVENEHNKKRCSILVDKIDNEKKNKKIVDTEKDKLQGYLENFVKNFFQLDIINKLYNTIDPHPEYKTIDFKCDFSYKDPRLNVIMYSERENHNSIVPNLYFSTAQTNILSFCIFMAKALFAKTDTGENLGCIFIDDPIQSLDDINILSMIDLLRNIAFSLDKQIVLTTHDRDFFELMKMKVPDRLFSSRFIEFKDRGVLE